MLLKHLDIITVLLAVVIFFLTFLLYSSYGPSKYKNLPPGPWGLPLFGNLFRFLKQDKVFLKLAKLAQTYGRVMRMRLGLCNAFILTGYDIMKEAMVDKGDVFSERPRWMHTVKELQRDKAGIFFHEGWRERRRFTLVSMRDFGLGKQSLEDRMMEEASCLNQELEKCEGKPVDPSVLLPFTTSNIICSIISGKRFQYGNAEFLCLTECINVLLKYGTGITIGNFIPYLRFIKPKEDTARLHAFTSLIDICNQWRKEHADTFDPNNIRDVIDLVLLKNKKNGSSDVMSDTDLVMTILELFLAGTETTSTTLCWALLYLIHNQTIQDKCRDEIKEAIGITRTPVFADNKNTPYINAVIHEVQRIGNIVPLSILHSPAVDAELSGYTIPAGSIIIMNMHTALRDPKYWTDPDTFNPDRWIGDDGKPIRNPAFIPFSTGKRVCLGEQLAKKELYIFLTSMLQKFKFSIVDEHNPPEVEGTGNTIHHPKPYKLIPTRL